MLFTKISTFALSLAALTASALAAATPARSEPKVVSRATELIQSGKSFTIWNAKAGTVVDLSGVNNKDIIGYPFHNGTNQQWTTIWTGHSWNIQSVSSPNLYMGISGTAGNGVNLTAVSTPTDWDIWHDTVNATNYRLYIPNTTQNWDLWGQGSEVPGDPITLWAAWEGIHQTWRFEAGT